MAPQTPTAQHDDDGPCCDDCELPIDIRHCEEIEDD